MLEKVVLQDGTTEEVAEEIAKYYKACYDVMWKIIESKLSELGVEIDYNDIQNLAENLKEQGVELKKIYTTANSPENSIMVIYKDDYIGRVYDPYFSPDEGFSSNIQIKYEWIKDKEIKNGTEQNT